uniref:Peptidyl-prolyl cis-trans isomerase n=1 Tax=Palpitomonas bilix TaxID=652834 RepID=A0A7S3GEA5_9EUKA|mmetsp:Transcript_45591/g.117851  ORF Transcript_45591/g.117851 Transcript_45591/m.117851 type:complete len:140 (+) Transcript_45591:64-483(+)|eukprot:CAMPEP_0113899212 /NCGR_PEP_ID=MMETSP0780_2-20120614/19876_1 /TAXON_ID=652834 /ORGANISM="Palpitomonas bilix" /LENGTH=139 /DNA_ID=CAMNT_0000891295 /DNA_START=64 /DNA_END=483 /DNA_ORIENTATION=+ /assembly_acc=CAM_ASM_000599
MGKKNAGGKGKGKGEAASGGGDKAAKKGGAKGDLKTCNFVKARHILCEKQGKLMDAYNKLREEFLDVGAKVNPAKFGQIAMEFSECSSGKRGGDLGWFPRGKMEGRFQEVAFGLAPGDMSPPFKGSNGWHLVLCEGRRA